MGERGMSPRSWLFCYNCSLFSFSGSPKGSTASSPAVGRFPPTGRTAEMRPFRLWLGTVLVLTASPRRSGAGCERWRLGDCGPRSTRPSRRWPRAAIARRGSG